MTPEDIKKMRIAFEHYTKALEEAITYSNYLMQEFENLCKEETETNVQQVQ